MSFIEDGVKGEDTITIAGGPHVVVPFPWYKRAWWWVLECIGIHRRPVAELKPEP